jgi:hypothetical protein
VLPGDDAGAGELSLGGAGLLAGDDAAGLSLAADAGGSEPGADPGAEGGDASPEAGLLSALKSRNAALTRFRLEESKVVLGAIYPRFWRRWKIPLSVSIGSRCPTRNANVSLDSVNTTVKVSSVTGIVSVAVPLPSVVSPVSCTSSGTENGWDAKDASGNLSVRVTVGGVDTNEFVDPGWRLCIAGGVGYGM